MTRTRATRASAGWAPWSCLPWEGQQPWPGESLRAELLPFRETSPDTEGPLSTHLLDALEVSAGLVLAGLAGAWAPLFTRPVLQQVWEDAGPPETPLVKARCFLF